MLNLNSKRHGCGAAGMKGTIGVVLGSFCAVLFVKDAKIPA
jgi:hypothetical protein